MKHAIANAILEPISFYLDSKEVCVMFHGKIAKTLLNNFVRQIDFEQFKIPRKIVADLYQAKIMKLEKVRNQEEEKERKLITDI